jgi:predicted MFS family arabinose efflux permease
MDDISSTREVETSERMNKTFVSTLVLGNLVTAFPMLVTSLLLIEISQSFGIEVGTANQIRTVGSIASLIMGLLMSGLNIRFRHKSLYVVGLGLMCLSALLIPFAPTFIILLGVFALQGVSLAMVRPIGQSLVGRFFSLQQRPKIMGYLIVGMASAYLVGSPLTSIISNWKLMFSIILFPFSLITFFLAFKGIPPTPKSPSSNQQYQKAFKEVLFNKSALACLIGGVLWIMPTNAVIVSLSSSFYRQVFLVNKLFMSFAFIVVSLITIFGSLVGGKVVNRFGRKRLTVISAFILGAIPFFYINIPNLWLSLIAWSVGAFFVGLINTAYSSLALEQAPDFRGTMMSLSEVSRYVAQALGNALAGFLLLAFNYSVVSFLGIFSLVGAFIFQFFTIELNKQELET